jgi:hypothetical protein
MGGLDGRVVKLRVAGNADEAKRAEASGQSGPTLMRLAVAIGVSAPFIESPVPGATDGKSGLGKASRHNNSMEVQSTNGGDARVHTISGVCVVFKH